MNDGLRQRIVGAVVLVALAVIFLPMVFEFDQPRRLDRRTLIPPQPEIAPVAIPQPQRTEAMVEPPPFETAFVPPEESVEQGDAAAPPVEETKGGAATTPDTRTDVAPEPSEPPRLSEQGIPVSWVLQVGSFRERDKATTLTENLRKQGYKAYLRSSTASGKSLHRVFIGPYVLKDKALADKSAVDRKYSVSSLLRKFEP